MITRIIIVVMWIVACLAPPISSAQGLGSDRLNLQDQIFRMESQIQTQEYKLLQQELKAQTPSYTYLLRQQSYAAPTIYQMEAFPTSSRYSINLEAGNLTNLSDHTGMFKSAMSVLDNGLKSYRPVQLEWKMSPGRLGPDVVVPNSSFPTPASSFAKGLSIGFGLGGALVRDSDMLGRGPLTTSRFIRYALMSNTLEETGSLGLGALREKIISEWGQQNLSKGIINISKSTYGMSDGIKAFTSYTSTKSLLNPETTNYTLRAIGMTAAGYALGSVGAATFDVMEKFLSAVTYSPIENLFMRRVRADIVRQYNDLVNNWVSAGQPVKSMVEVYGAKNLREWGFNSNITGIPTGQKIPQSYGPQRPGVERFSSHSANINNVMNLGNIRIEQSGYIYQERVTNLNTGTVTTNRQWSTTTHTYTYPMSSAPMYTMPTYFMPAYSLPTYSVPTYTVPKSTFPTYTTPQWPSSTRK